MFPEAETGGLSLGLDSTEYSLPGTYYTVFSFWRYDALLSWLLGWFSHTICFAASHVCMVFACELRDSSTAHGIVDGPSVNF